MGYKNSLKMSSTSSVWEEDFESSVVEEGGGEDDWEVFSASGFPGVDGGVVDTDFCGVGELAGAVPPSWVKLKVISCPMTDRKVSVMKAPCFSSLLWAILEPEMTVIF